MTGLVIGDGAVVFSQSIQQACESLATSSSIMDTHNAGALGRVWWSFGQSGHPSVVNQGGLSSNSGVFIGHLATLPHLAPEPESHSIGNLVATSTSLDIRLAPALTPVGLFTVLWRCEHSRRRST